jgi:uracil phosphoribosyltransferase
MRVERALRVSDHPLAASKLSILRNATTGPEEFRRALREVSTILVCEAARAWELGEVEVNTPLARAKGALLAHPVVAVPILRAGLGMLEGLLALLPEAQIGHIGLYRDEETLRPVSYFCRLPVSVGEAQVLLLDPMLATGYSACEAVSLLKAQGAARIQMLCIVACPAGVRQLHTQHPGIPIFTAALDPELDTRGYIVPGLGDAGDRCFGTG